MFLHRVLVRFFVVVLAGSIFAPNHMAPLGGAMPEGPAVAPLNKTIDDLLALVGNDVPEFAGVIADGFDRIKILIQGASATLASEAKSALAAYLSSDFASKDVEVLPATHSFLQLKAWRDQLRAEVFGIDGVTLNSFDIRRNGLKVGVRDVALYEAQVRAIVEKLEIPQEVVAVVEFQTVRSLSDLNDRHRPIIGGLKIASLSPPGGSCTLAVPATRLGFNGFLTASHCGTFGVVDGYGYAQPVFSPTGCNPFNPNICNNIGWEVADGTPFAGGGCPSSEVCRWADAEFDRTLAGVTLSRGRIAKPSVPPPGTSWAGADWRVVGDFPAVEDAFVTKIGISTGSLGGTVIDSCADVINELNYVMLCQVAVEYSGTPLDGDSGGPVFQRVGGTAKDVKFAGIHWGVPDGLPLIGIYSSILNLQKTQELGPVNTCDPLFPC